MKGFVRSTLGNRQKCRLLIDVTMINKNDAGTGIQRVVRALALQEQEMRSRGWDVWYVIASRRESYHRINWPGDNAHCGNSDINAQPGDIFLGLDYSLDTVRIHEKQLRRLSAQGVGIWFLVHDLLPIQRPDWFSPDNVARYRKWIRILASLADGFFCNSAQTETELRTILAARFHLVEGYHTHVLPMGTDIRASLHTTGFPDRFDDLLAVLDTTPTVLMVGTLEPRKGHADVLDAFDLLWNQGFAYNLVLVGRAGWKVGLLVERLKSHPMLGHKLYWLNNASDEALMRLYEVCDGVMLASLAEGFGLPLTEALRYRKPVLARNLSIFRRDASASIRYFSQNANTQEIARAITNWVGEIRTGNIVVRPEVDTDWVDSVRSMLSALE